MDIDLLKEDLIEFLYENVFETYYELTPSQIESWIREFFDQLEE